MKIIKFVNTSDTKSIALVTLSTTPDCFGVAKFEGETLKSVAWSTEDGASKAFDKEVTA